MKQVSSPNFLESTDFMTLLKLWMKVHLVGVYCPNLTRVFS